MNPVQKGIGIIALVTGVTMLAIGCSNNEDETSAESTSTPSENTQTGLGAVTKPETPAVSDAPIEAATKSVKSDTQAVAPIEVATDKSIPAPPVQAEAKNEAEATSLAPPPPGLFHEKVHGETEAQVVAPRAPEAPGMPAALTPPKQPEEPKPAMVESVAPSAPEMGSAAVKAPVAVHENTKPAPHANPANVAQEIPPPPMPNLEQLKADSKPAPGPGPQSQAALQAPTAPVAAEKPAMEAPKPPVMKRPKMQHPNTPPSTGLANNQRAQVPDVGSMNMPSTNMQMPNMNMRMPSPNMNMNPNAFYAPRVYYVPVPMYPYGQPYAPYGYPAGSAPSQPQQTQGQVQQKAGSK